MCLCVWIHDISLAYKKVLDVACISVVAGYFICWVGCCAGQCTVDPFGFKIEEYIVTVNENG